MNTPITRALAALAIAFACSSAQAQSVDYGAFEQLFGEPVTTSATGSPQRASEAPTTMEIVTADEIRRSGAIDIPGVLRHVAGIDVLQWTNAEADVGIRGYNQSYSPRILVLIDGRQVYADFSGYTPWTALPVELDEIRQIEVVKGPNSALFGFNAVGGVINIITTNPLFDDANTVSLTGGTQGTAQGTAVKTIKLGDAAALRIAVGGRSNNDFSTPQRSADMGARRGDNRGEINVLGRMRLDGLELGIELTHSEADQTEMLPHHDGEHPQSHTYYDRYGTYSVKGQISSDTDFGLIQGTVYSNWIKSDDFPPQDEDPIFHFTNQVTVAQMEDIFKLGSTHTIRASLEYRHDTAGTTPVEGSHVFYDVASAGLMWDWKIDPSLSLTNAVRLDNLFLGRDGALLPGFGLNNEDWNRKSLSEVSFNSGLVWQASALDTLRVTVARGVQIPALVAFGALLFNEDDGFIGGIPDLNPTIVTNYELGWDRMLPSFDARLKISAFHQSTDDIVSNFGGRLFSAGLTDNSANIGRSTASGIELSIQGKFQENWRWGVSYTPEIITDSFLPGFVVDTTLIDYQHTAPVHVVNVNLGWSRGKWEIDGYLRYESGFYGVQSNDPGPTELTRVPGYVSVDARIGYKPFDWATISLSGQNISQAQQRQTISPDVERRVFGTLTIYY